MALEVEFTEIEPQLSLSIGTRSPQKDLPEVIGKSYKEIAEYINTVGAQYTGAPFVIYYNMDMNDLDIEIGFPVDKQYDGHNSIKSSEVPGGKVFKVTHIGPYSDLKQTYEQIIAYINENKIETAGYVCESYPNDPAVTPPAELKTDITFYLKD